ncbi:hypothetical protein [Plantactinospora sp. B5E13]|uniref:hypothetical protein n=1 Tax=Plantactinospora sp. B5E13 TaxID=3153758 RepID=UPI00325D2D98
MTPQQFLDAAARLMTAPTPSTRRCWQRGSACLTRIALEHGLRGFWQRQAPSVLGCRMRQQLIVLSSLLDAETARTARAAWYGLSRAMHHHTYELAPTVAELDSWHRDVTRLLDRLDNRTEVQP